MSVTLSQIKGIGTTLQGWSAVLDSIVAGGFILKDQFNEQAISTVSDSWNTDSTTTIIADPDYGYAAINGSLFVRQTIQLQSFGGSTASQLNNDGSGSLGGGGLTWDSSGLITSDLHLSTALYTGPLIYDNSNSLGTTGQVLTNNVSEGVQWAYPQYANGNPLVDSISNLLYPAAGQLADTSGNLYTAAIGYIFVSGIDGSVYYVGTGGSYATMVDTNNLFYPAQFATGSEPAWVNGAVIFNTTLNKLRIGGATGWETVTSV